MVCKFHVSYGNGFGDIWWTDILFYFSSIDALLTNRRHMDITESAPWGKYYMIILVWLTCQTPAVGGLIVCECVSLCVRGHVAILLGA